MYMYTSNQQQMETVTYTSLRKNLAHWLEEVTSRRSAIAVTRKQHEPVIIMSLADYKSIEETMYLLKSPENARRIYQGLQDHKSGEGVEHDLLEL